MDFSLLVNHCSICVRLREWEIIVGLVELGHLLLSSVLCLDGCWLFLFYWERMALQIAFSPFFASAQSKMYICTEDLVSEGEWLLQRLPGQPCCGYSTPFLVLSEACTDPLALKLLHFVMTCRTTPSLAFQVGHWVSNWSALFLNLLPDQFWVMEYWHPVNST